MASSTMIRLHIVMQSVEYFKHKGAAAMVYFMAFQACGCMRGVRPDELPPLAMLVSSATISLWFTRLQSRPSSASDDSPVRYAASLACVVHPKALVSGASTKLVRLVGFYALTP